MKKKCLALFSGGLDSMLAMKIISDQGIAVHALNIDIGFGSNPEKNAIMEARAKMAGASFESINVRSKYLQNVLFTPKFGYGKAFNPCIDCHGFMFSTAISMLDDYDASFVISGEVVGQRPMSQRNDAMAHVKKLGEEALNAESADIILRPLSAKLLKPTRPEIMGIVDREKLLNFSGRGRNPQLNLAKKFGFSDFESPGGGCPYTMAAFANKIRDFIKFDPKMSEDDLQSLRYGRHLRLPNGAKMIIGRDESENEKLKALNLPKMSEIKNDLIGAFCLISADADASDKALGARLALTYSKSQSGQEYLVEINGEKLGAFAMPSKNDAAPYFIN